MNAISAQSLLSALCGTLTLIVIAIVFWPPAIGIAAVALLFIVVAWIAGCWRRGVRPESAFPAGGIEVPDRMAEMPEFQTDLAPTMAFR
jgi:hypothetical protein